MLQTLARMYLVFCFGALAVAQDPVRVAPDNYRVLLENDSVRVLEGRLKPGDRTPLHSHPSRVVYSLSDHTAIFRFPDGRVVHSTSKAGEVVWRDPVVHSEENDGNADSRAIIIELKETPQTTDALLRSDFFVAGEPGVRLFVRHVAAGTGQKMPILLVHGGGPPSEVVFDLPVPGYSLAEDLARMGLDVFLTDARC